MRWLSSQTQQMEGFGARILINFGVSNLRVLFFVNLAQKYLLSTNSARLIISLLRLWTGKGGKHVHVGSLFFLVFFMFFHPCSSCFLLFPSFFDMFPFPSLFLLVFPGQSLEKSKSPGGVLSESGFLRRDRGRNEGDSEALPSFLALQRASFLPDFYI